jgi:hypothetical protein
MRYRLRTLLIVLAIGLALLQFAIFMIPYEFEMPGGTDWFLCLDFVSYVVPLVQLSALTIALTIRDGSFSSSQSHAPILRFSIRDVLWLTVVVGLGVAWWQGYVKLATQLADSEIAHRNWRFRAEHLRGQLNGIKLGGKWLMPYRLEFSPDSEEIHTVARQSGGDWVAPAGTTIEWRQDWAELR